MREIDAFILIGGRSSRLGTDKALVELGGMTLAERAVDIVRNGISPKHVTFVAGAAPRFGIEAIRVDAEFVFDLYEDRGPLGGLHAALANARSDWLFLMACDYPFVSSEFLKLLAGHVSDTYASVVPEQADGRLQPLCAFYSVATTGPVVEEILSRPRVPPPMHEIVMQLEPRIFRFGEYSHLPGADRFFTNINTPDDLKIARTSL